MISHIFIVIFFFLFFSLGDFQAAIDEYDKAIELEPRHFKAHFNRGFAFDKVN